MSNDTYKQQEKIHLKVTQVIVLLAFMAGTIALLVSFALTAMKLWVFAIGIASIWILYTLIYFYLNAFYKHYSYHMNEQGLFIHQGVFWQKKIVVPMNRVQHTDVTQGPLARKFNLAELIVHTAGTRNASVKLQGILHKDAEALRSTLSFQQDIQSL